MTTTFTWSPDIKPQATKQPRIRAVQYGSGYEQRSPDGINNNPISYSLTFSNRTPTEAQQIDDFLSALGGVSYFLWTPPRGSTALKWICKTWTREYTANGIDSITATFQQVFDN